MNTKTAYPSAKKLAIVLLVLWCVIIFGFFTLSLLALDCQYFGHDCSAEFLKEVSTMRPVLLTIPFAFFFFIPLLCNHLQPEVFERVIPEQALFRPVNVLRVLSPPPRFS